MGNTSYSIDSRIARESKLEYATAHVSTLFTQSTEKKIHGSMSPKGVTVREARDSDNHPNTVPIILTLDVTGSMGKIPEYLIREGLPKIMGGIIQKGISDPALLFLAVGDHETDGYPLQVGQFESGDEELDTWLTRTYLEGGGGGNAGESYLLAWYFAANHTVTDAWEKRKEKGILFTIGDEPGLTSLPQNVVREIMDNNSTGQYTDKSLLATAQEKWDVYHIVVKHTDGARRSVAYWKELLGQCCIEVNEPRDVSAAIIKIVTERVKPVPITETNESKPTAFNEEEILL